MSRVAATKPHLSFLKGLVTETSSLANPEDIATDLDNVVVNRDGSIQRRLGVDFETGYTASIGTSEEPSSDLLPTYALTMHEWSNVRNEGDKSYFVAQVGSYLHVFKSFESNISSNLLASIDYTVHATSGNADNARNNPIGVSSVKGRLLVTNKHCDAFYLEEDSSGNITSTAIAIKVRDFKKLEDGLESTDRSTINNERRYNLQNAGWPTEFDCWTSASGSGTTFTNAIDYTKLKTTFYPSLTDTFSFFIQSSASSVSVNDAFNPFIITRKFLSTGVSPSGHYIYNLFDQDRVTASGISGIENTREEDVRFRLSTSYQGRVFYAGLDSDNLENGVYFSQTLTSFDLIGTCHTAHDPTDPFISDVLDTDGGFIPLQEAGKITYLGSINNNLIVGAVNGVWSISGLDSGFTANNYSINKITSDSFLSQYSAVLVGNTLLYWGSDAIYAAAPNDFGTIVVNDLTVNSIQTKFNELNQQSKETCQGVYDSINNLVYWFYGTTSDGVSDRYKFNKLILLDLTSGAFFTYSIGDSTPYIAGALETSTLGNITVSYDVVIGTDDVVQGSDDVVADISTPTFGVASPGLKLMTVIDSDNSGKKNITFSEFNSTRFLDWYTYDSTGVNYNSFAETGWEHLGEFGREKQVLDMQCLFNITEDGFELDVDGNIVLSNQSGCKFTAKWDYGSTDGNNRNYAVDNVYRLKDLYIPEDVNDTFDYGYLVNRVKTGVRGQGTSLQYRFESIQGKDFQLLGWVTDYAVNGRS